MNAPSHFSHSEPRRIETPVEPTLDKERMKRILTQARECFACKKEFKKPDYRLIGDEYKPISSSPDCPHCHSRMLTIGDTFRAPKTEDVEAWQSIECEVLKGRRFSRDEAFEYTPRVNKLSRTPKGIRSVFPVKARKRKRISQQLLSPDGIPLTTARC